MSYEATFTSNLDATNCSACYKTTNLSRLPGVIQPITLLTSTLAVPFIPPSSVMTGIQTHTSMTKPPELEFVVLNCLAMTPYKVHSSWKSWG